MPASVDSIADELRKVLALPDGYCLFVDYQTDNIFVVNTNEEEARHAMAARTDTAADGRPLWAFAMTRKTMHDNVYLDHAKNSLAHLINVVSNTEYVRRVNQLG